MINRAEPRACGCSRRSRRLDTKWPETGERQLRRQTKLGRVSEGRRRTRLASSRTGYVAKAKMWRREPERPHSLGLPDLPRHILFRLREPSQTSFGENRVGVFKYRLHLAVVFSRHAYGPLVEDRKALLKYPTLGNTRHSTHSQTLWVLNKMWRTKPENSNKGGVFRPVRHIFALATYPV